MATSPLAKAGQLVVRPLGALAAGLTRIQQSLYLPPSKTIAGVSDSNFPTALQPVRPFGNENSKPLGMNLQMGQNLIFTPRPDARYTTPELQAYAAYPLARICIEMVKNIVADMPWKIQLKAQPGENKKERESKQLKDDIILKLTEFIGKPNADEDFKTFTRRVLEDMLVCDAASILLRYDKKGTVYEWRALEGAYITRLVTDEGYTPDPPSPAYQQCYADGTDVLTTRGWLRLDDVDIEHDMVATRNLRTKRFEWQRPTAKQAYEFSGELYNFKSRDIDIAVTPDHRMIIGPHIPFKLGGHGKRPKGDGVVTAQQLAESGNRGTGIPVTSVWEGVEIGTQRFPKIEDDKHLQRLEMDRKCRDLRATGLSYEKIGVALNIPMIVAYNAIKRNRKRQPQDTRLLELSGDDYCALMGLYLSEGSCDKQLINIAQTKHNPRCPEVEAALTRILGYTPNYNGKSYVFSCKALREHLQPMGHAHEKCIPPAILNATARQMKIFWHHYWLGDGAAGRNRISTSSRQMADDLQELAQKMGKFAYVRVAKKITADRMIGTRVIKAKNLRPHYIVCLHTRGQYSTGFKANKLPYSGMVRCLSVPNTTLYVRRNGKAAWCGNCWEGMPLNDLSTDQLIYRPRNICYRVGTISYSLYGLSPTEILAQEIEVGIQRLNYVTAFYKDGSVPNMLWIVPPDATPDKVKEAMTIFNSDMAGNLQARRMAKFAQGFVDKGEDKIHQFKEPELADNYDDLHIRKLAAGYGVSAQRLLRMQNRATATSNQDAAEEEGIAPYLGWYAGVINEIIQYKMGYAKYEFVYDTSRDPDPVKQSEMDMNDVKGGIETINGARLRRGWDTSSDPAADVLAVTTAQGRVPIGQVVTPPTGNEPTPKPGVDPANPNPAEPDANVGKVTKSNRPLAVIDPKRDSIRSRSAVSKIHSTFLNFFNHIASNMVIVAKPTKKVRKGQNSSDDKEQIEQIVDAIMESIQWSVLPTAIEGALQDAGLDGVDTGLDQVERMEQVASGEPITLSPSPVRVVTQSLISETNRVAMDYAHDRAAELVGMKWVDGELVVNPNPKWAITDSTRNMLRDIITDSFKQNVPMSEFTQRIKDAGVFSDERAKMIADTEVKAAMTGGNYAGWEKSGLVKTVRSLLSNNHTGLDECDENAEAGPIPLGTEFPSGDLHSPFHPRCQCSVVAVSIGGLSRKW